MLDDVFADARRRAGKLPTKGGVEQLMRLSVLDLVPVRSDQTTADVGATVRLAQTADRLGFTRYWLAEHHNMPAVAATSPPVLIAYLAGPRPRTAAGLRRVMLPNHAPLAVAPSSSRCWRPPRRAASTWASAGPGLRPGDLDHVARYRRRRRCGELPAVPRRCCGADGAAGVRIPIRGQGLHPQGHPGATGEPRIWLLGSSAVFRRIWRRPRACPVFAHHFSGRARPRRWGYRSEFRPSDLAAEPVTFMTVNAVVAPTRPRPRRCCCPTCS